MIVRNEPCPSCRAEGRDKTGNHLMIFENGNEYCNRCNYKVIKGHTKKDMPSNSTIGIDEVLNLPFKEVRGIRSEIREHYGCHTAVSEYDGKTVERIYYPRYQSDKLTGFKIRQLPKDFSKKVGDTQNSDLWGKHAFAPTKTLIITEGEEDAMAIWQSIVDNGGQHRKLRAVVSLANGCNSVAKELHAAEEYIAQFDEVVLCFDQDEAGKAAVTNALQLLPQCKVATLPSKDANEMIEQGKSDELFQAVIFQSKQQKPDGIVSVGDVWEEAIKPIERGLSWPWPTITSVTYGIRRKELYGFGGGTGCGKTEGFKELIQHLLSYHGLPVGLFFLEEEPAYTAKVISGKSVNKKFHVPDDGWTTEELEDAMLPLKDKCFMYNHQGTKDWESIKAYIRYFVVVMGIRDIFLDNLTALVSHTDDVNKELSSVMAEMSGLAEELEFTLYFISHLNTPIGKPHEEGGRVTVANFRGSRTVAFWANYLFGYERNQQAEDEDEKNTTTFRVLKDRYTGMATGKTVKLFYDHTNGRMLEKQELF